MVDILVLYCSQDGSVHKLAQQVARGVNSVNGAEAKLRSVPNIKQPKNNLFAPEIKLSEIEECDGLALGSPTHFGNMSGAMKNFIDELTPLWFKGSLESKVGTVFTSSHSLHGGNEATLLSMQIPLQHLGMLIMGIPYSIKELNTTKDGGTPYGASHVGDQAVTAVEEKIAYAQGKRLAELTIKLRSWSLGSIFYLTSP